jgi:hypothetical protein
MRITDCRRWGVQIVVDGVILHPKITLKAGYEMTVETMSHLHEHVPEHGYRPLD